jgi:methyl-accepting chemotaxis protein
MMITSQGLVLTYKNTDACGQNVADISDDPFLTAIGKFVAEEAGKENHEVANVKIAGEKYYLAASPVSGTDWFVIAYAKQKEVLSALARLVAILVVVAAIAVVAVIIEHREQLAEHQGDGRHTHHPSQAQPRQQGSQQRYEIAVEDGEQQG